MFVWIVGFFAYQSIVTINETNHKSQLIIISLCNVLNRNSFNVNSFNWSFKLEPICCRRRPHTSLPDKSRGEDGGLR